MGYVDIRKAINLHKIQIFKVVTVAECGNSHGFLNFAQWLGYIGCIPTLFLGKY